MVYGSTKSNSSISNISENVKPLIKSKKEDINSALPRKSGSKDVESISPMWKKTAKVTNSTKTPSLTSKTEPNINSSTSNERIPQNTENFLYFI